MMDKNKMFQHLFKAACAAEPAKCRKAVQQECSKLWNDIKTKDEFLDLFDHKMKDLKLQIEVRKERSMRFFSCGSREASSSESHSENQLPGAAAKTGSVSQDSSGQNSNADGKKEHPIATEKQHPSASTPKQDTIRKQLEILNADLSGLMVRKENEMLSCDQSLQLAKLRKEKFALEKNLEKLEKGMERQQHFRQRQKRHRDELIENDPSKAKKLRCYKSAGRPPLPDQDQILKAIVDIAQYGAGAQEKRRFDELRTVKTLDDMTDKLKELGYTMSRSYVYYRLMPRRKQTTEAKKHVNSVPVRLTRASNDSHKYHRDTKFCAATIHRLDELASFLGPEDVARLSQDDKARVPLGITAATHQAPILMHMEYRVRLPDHDWVVAEKHKLIPSVYAGLEIKRNGFGDSSFVSSSGPTFIAIRSAKHSRSTAYAHAMDFNHLLQISSFDSIMKTSQGAVKPVVIVTVDGGPDENPRFAKCIDVAIHHFKTYDLDAYFVATNAPGRSAFNPVERRMAPLSRQLSGLILPHNKYGSHLNSQGKTVDDELETKNFQNAGETLAEVWNDVMIDGYEVTAEYIMPECSEIDKSNMKAPDEEWRAKHVRTSQYFLQIVKCTDDSCCTPFRSKYGSYFVNRFLPAPLPLTYEPQVEVVDNTSVANETKSESNVKFTTLFQSLALFDCSELPYDHYCPSVADKVTDRICAECQTYFASTTLLKSHRKIHGHQRSVVRRKPKTVIAKSKTEVLACFESDAEDCEAEWLDQEFVDVENYMEDVNDEVTGIPTVTMEQHFSTPWEFVSV